MFYFSYLSPKMALSRADGANHRKPERHCFAFLQPQLMWLHPRAQCFCKGEIWSVEPPGCLGSGCNDLSESVAAAPTQGLTCSVPMLEKRAGFSPLVSLILKECGIPSDSGCIPKYINLLVPAGQEKSSEGLDMLAIFCKQF